MLPIKIKNKIIAIGNLFNNYEYMKKNKAELLEIQENIIKIINDLDFYKNDAVVNVVFGYQNKALNSKFVIDTEKFYENSNSLKLWFSKFLKKLNIRLNTIEIGKIEFSEAEKNNFYYMILNFIEQNQKDLLEKLLNENLIDINYVPSMENDEDEEYDQDEGFAVPLIIAACKQNNLAIVKMLHNNNANLNVNINDNYENDVSPLLAATMNRIDNDNDNELIIYLLDNGANPNFIGGLGEVPLKEIIDDLELFEKMIIKYHANVNFHYFGGSVLLYACEISNFEAIKILLANGADVNLRDDRNDTPLYYLFFESNIETDFNNITSIIDLFIAKNFNFNFQNPFCNNTIIHSLSNMPGGTKIINYLLSKSINYDVNLLNIDGDSSLHILLNNQENDDQEIIETINWFIKYNFRFDCINASGETILHKILKNSVNLTITKCLLDKNININAKTISGDTALHYLINSFKSENYELIKQIIELFATSNFNFDSQNHFGETILHRAVKMEINSDIIEFLLNKSTNINIANNEGKTVLQLAEICKNIEIFNVINNWLSANPSNNTDKSNSVKGQKRKLSFDATNQKRFHKK